jgi:hypothetical protein
MIVAANTVLGDTWRIGVTLVALGVIGGFWYLIVSNITPFPSARAAPGADSSDDGDLDGDAPSVPQRKYPRLTPSRYPKIQRFSVRCDIVLFVWIVLEGVIVVPIMLIKYGLH